MLNPNDNGHKDRSLDNIYNGPPCECNKGRASHNNDDDPGMGTLWETHVQNQSDLYDVTDAEDGKPVKRPELMLQAQI